MGQFFYMIADFFGGIFNLFNNTYFRFADGASGITNLGSVFFAMIVVGFCISLFWRGAKT